MKKLRLREEGSASLYENCSDVTLDELDDPLFAKQVKQMYKLMEASDGVGLAAPQVGILKNFFIMEYDNQKFTIINPTIMELSEEKVEIEEGCLSFPGLFLKIERPAVVTASFKDINGDLHAHEFGGMWARIFLHEYDHLQGKVFTSGISNVKLTRARSKAKKFLKQTA